MLVIGFVSLIFDNAKLIERNDKISHWMNTAFAAFGEALIRKHVKFIQSFKKHNCLITVLLFVLAMSWIVWETFVTEFLMNFFFPDGSRHASMKTCHPPQSWRRGYAMVSSWLNWGISLPSLLCQLSAFMTRTKLGTMWVSTFFYVVSAPPPPETNYDTSGNKWLHLLLSFVAVSLLICTEYEKIIIINFWSLEWCHWDTYDFPSPKKKILS